MEGLGGPVVAHGLIPSEGWGAGSKITAQELGLLEAPFHVPGLLAPATQLLV